MDRIFLDSHTNVLLTTFNGIQKILYEKIMRVERAKSQGPAAVNRFNQV